MSRSSLTPASPFWRTLSSLVAGVTLALLLGGQVMPHGAAEEHTDLPIGTRLDANAQHPAQPLHMETSAPEVVHACTACLLQTGTRSTLSRPVAVPLPLTLPSEALPDVERSDAAPVRRLGPARAPPAVSPLA